MAKVSYSKLLPTEIKMIFLYKGLLLVSTLVSVQSQYCANVPSGIERLRNGVDITQLDLLPLDITKDSGFRTPIIDFTCAEKKTTIISGVRKISCIIRIL